MQGPLPRLPIQLAGLHQLLHICRRSLRSQQGVIVVQVELLEYHRGTRTRVSDSYYESRANSVVRGIVVNFAKQPVSCSRNVSYQLPFADEALRTDVPDSGLARRCVNRGGRRACR
jgi:hypothetical protein